MSELTPSRDNLRSAYVFAEGQVAEREDVEAMEAEFRRAIAAIEQEAAARALEEAADGITVFPEQELTDGFDHGADAVYDALRARAAEIREGKGDDPM